MNTNRFFDFMDNAFSVIIPIILAGLLVFLCYLLYLLFTRSGEVDVRIDPQTKCEYLVGSSGTLTPRLMIDGKQRGCIE
jgi:hypothetical protein